MPSTGRAIARDYTAAERETLGDSLPLLGSQTFDIYLNDRAYWRCVPERVWRYTLGGYQVIKKWLSYREQSLLGRPLREDEAREVTAMTRRIAALLLLQPALDANYRASKSNTYQPVHAPKPPIPLIREIRVSSDRTLW